IAQLGKISGGDRRSRYYSEIDSRPVSAKPTNQANERDSEANRRQDIVLDPVKRVLRDEGDEQWNADSHRNSVGENNSRCRVTKPDERGDQSDVEKANPIKHAAALRTYPLANVEPDGRHYIIKRRLRAFLIWRVAPDLFDGGGRRRDFFRRMGP